MLNIRLIDNRVKSLNLNADINAINLQLGSKLEYVANTEYSVSYSDDFMKCLATLKQVLKSKEYPEEIYLEIVFEGLFETEDLTSIEKRKEAHVECYNMLFPYARSIITQVFANSSLHGMQLSPIKMCTEDVVIN